MNIYITIYRAVIIVTSVLLFTSCHDTLEVDNQSNGKDVHFTVSMDSNDGFKTRASEPGTVANFTVAKDVDVIPMQGDVNGKRMYLHCTESDNDNDPIGKSSLNREDLGGSSSTTRATAITSTNFYSKIKAFGVTSNNIQIFSDQDNGSLDVSGPDWMTSYMWPREYDNFTFYAFAPSSIRMNGNDGDECIRISSEIPAANYNGLSFDYLSPSRIDYQKDLLVAASEQCAGRTYQIVDMKFKHALTALRFVFEDLPAGTEITSINIGGYTENTDKKGFYTQGTCSYSNGIWTWTTSGDQNSYQISRDKPAKVVGENYTLGTSYVASDVLSMYESNNSDLVLVVPQVLPEDAKIVAKMKIGGVEKTLSASIAGTEWKMGKLMTYHITASEISWEYKIDVVHEPNTYPAAGGTQNDAITFRSYRQKIGATDFSSREPIGYTLSYSKDDGESWTQDINNANTPGLTMTAESATSVEHDERTGEATLGYKMADITSYSTTTMVSHRAALRKDTEVLEQYGPETGKYYNLSYPANPESDDAFTTANTYVINGPGWYRLPLVYGNARKNNSNNTNAYNGFLDRNGEAITLPYISGAESADMVWQEVDGCISEVSLSADKQFLQFKVDPEKIDQGNSLLAIKDASGKILWSWQIWVTSYDLSQTVQAYGGSVMRFTLGHREVGEDPQLARYDDKTIKVKITQDGTGKTAIVDLKQRGKSYYSFDGAEEGATSPFYQWGRKDPLKATGDIPYVSVDMRDANNASQGRPYYDIYQDPETYFMYWYQTTRTDDYAIVYDWQTLKTVQQNTVKLWRTDLKTIYDPCPSGFRVPIAGLLKNTTPGAEYRDITNGYGGFILKSNNTAGFYLIASGFRAPRNGSSMEYGNRVDHYFKEIEKGRIKSDAFTWLSEQPDASLLLPKCFTWYGDVNSIQDNRGALIRADALPILPMKE